MVRIWSLLMHLVVVQSGEEYYLIYLALASAQSPVDFGSYEYSNSSSISKCWRRSLFFQGHFMGSKRHKKFWQIFQNVKFLWVFGKKNMRKHKSQFPKWCQTNFSGRYVWLVFLELHLQLWSCETKETFFCFWIHFASQNSYWRIGPKYLEKNRNLCKKNVSKKVPSWKIQNSLNNNCSHLEFWMRREISSILT